MDMVDYLTIWLCKLRY